MRQAGLIYQWKNFLTLQQYGWRYNSNMTMKERQHQKKKKKTLDENGKVWSYTRTFSFKNPLEISNSILANKMKVNAKFHAGQTNAQWHYLVWWWMMQFECKNVSLLPTRNQFALWYSDFSLPCLKAFITSCMCGFVSVAHLPLKLADSGINAPFPQLASPFISLQIHSISLIGNPKADIEVRQQRRDCVCWHHDRLPGTPPDTEIRVF